MPRPCKRRRVCAMPGCRRFSPAESSGEKPIELLTTQTGTQVVEDLLEQMDYGVYV